MSSVRPQQWWRGARGEWFSIVQILLSAVVFLGPHRVCGQPAWPLALGGAGPAVGGVLMVAGSVLFLAGLVRLGSGLTPLPYPKEGARLVQSGAYGLVRHPLYCGVLAGSIGWALLVQSWLTLAYVVPLFIVLDLKSRREERWLTERFPAYREYQRRVRRLVPFVY